MWLAAGVVLMVSGLVGWLYDAHLGRQRTWDRPGWSLRPIPRAGFAIARRVLVIAGWILILLASKWAGAIVAVVLIAAWGRVRWVRSDRSTTRRLEVELADLRRQEPSSDHGELLARVVRARHPEWTADLVSQIIRDHPTPEGVARIVARMERGWASLSSAPRWGQSELLDESPEEVLDSDLPLPLSLSLPLPLSEDEDDEEESEDFEPLP